MAYRVCKVDGRSARIARTLLAIDHQLFGDHQGSIVPAEGWWWLVYDEAGKAVAYAGVKQSSYDPSTVGYLNRSGVLPAHRGHGLQKRLIKARVTFARKHGWEVLVTDTTDNPASANSLIACGFQTFTPKNLWAFTYSIYWRKKLS